jgi:peptidoglycan hydrolase-like protein with peptidoglycan-binding domain
VQSLALLLTLYLALAAGQAAPLAQGARGPVVAALQSELGVRPDGLYGPATAARVRAVQAAQRLATDGVVGMGTLAAVIRSELPRVLLRPGDSGPLVAFVQRRLDARNFAAGPSDGRFGPATEAAVRAYQASAHLAVDGVVGPATLGALLDPTVVVRSGDTLSALAVRYGVTVADLEAANGLSGDLIRVGESLRVPVFGPAAAPLSGGTPTPAVTSAGSHAASGGSGGGSDGAFIPASSLTPAHWGAGATPEVAIGLLAGAGALLPRLPVPYTAFVTALPANPTAAAEVELAAASAADARAGLAELRLAHLTPHFLLPIGGGGAWTLSVDGVRPILGLTPTAPLTPSSLVGGQLLLVRDTPSDLAALKRLLPVWQRAGYRFLTVSALYPP